MIQWARTLICKLEDLCPNLQHQTWLQVSVTQQWRAETGIAQELTGWPASLINETCLGLYRQRVMEEDTNGLLRPPHVCSMFLHLCIHMYAPHTHTCTRTHARTRTRIHTRARPKLIKRSVHPDWELCDPMAMTLSWCHPRDGQAYLGCWGCQAHIEYTKFDGEASSTAQRLPEPGFNIVFCVYVRVCMYADMCSCKSVYTRLCLFLVSFSTSFHLIY